MELNFLKDEKIKKQLCYLLSQNVNLVSVVTDKTDNCSIERNILNYLETKKFLQYNWKIIRYCYYPALDNYFNNVEHFIENNVNYENFGVLINGVERFHYGHYETIKRLKPKKLVIIGNTSNSLNEPLFMKFLMTNVIDNKLIDFITTKSFDKIKSDILNTEDFNKLKHYFNENCKELEDYNLQFSTDIKEIYKLKSIVKYNERTFDKNLFNYLKEASKIYQRYFFDMKNYDKFLYTNISKSILQYTFFCAELELVST